MQQMTLGLPVLPTQRRLRVVSRVRAESGAQPEQLAIDFTLPTAMISRIPRRSKSNATCSMSEPITRDGVTLPACEWAARLGLKWITVKMRRMRGDNWTSALNPELKRSTFMSGWKMHG